MKLSSFLFLLSVGVFSGCTCSSRTDIKVEDVNLQEVIKDSNEMKEPIPPPPPKPVNSTARKLQSRKRK